jgi:phosphoribosylglycinamide formyltransferase-1
MYGGRVFQAVIDAGETESGVSIHIVDGDIDTGRVVRQCKVPVFPGDSSEVLKTRVRMREREFVVETLADIARGAVTLDETG